MRVEYGEKIVAYSGDTQWTDALLKAANGADLFVAEAYFFEKQIRFHLDFRTLESHRMQLGCRRLVLTHMSEDMLRRRKDVAIECAHDGNDLLALTRDARPSSGEDSSRLWVVHCLAPILISCPLPSIASEPLNETHALFDPRQECLHIVRQATWKYHVVLVYGRVRESLLLI